MLLASFKATESARTAVPGLIDLLTDFNSATMA
jgi:hypothetical protein